MKKTLLALTLGAACVAGFSHANAQKQESGRQFEGYISVTAPACNNNPWVRFRENEYRAVCGDFDFTHKCEEACSEDMFKFINQDIWPVGMERWIDDNADGTAEIWQNWAIDSTGMSYVTDSRAPPSLEDQHMYNNTLYDIGKEDIQSKWEEWKNQGGN